MDRRLFLGAAGGAAALATPAIAQTQNPEIRWRMPSSFPRNLDVLFGSCEKLSQRVAQLTHGRSRITPFRGGEDCAGAAGAGSRCSRARSNAATPRRCSTHRRSTARLLLLLRCRAPFLRYEPPADGGLDALWRTV